jgi:Protein kinase domain
MTTIGPYLLLDRLGEGGNGQVFKARHQAMQRVVALKILREELLADAEAVGRFYREIEVVSQIAHPNIVHAYDAGPIGASLVLAMEYIDGVDLDRLIRESGPLPVPQACAYIQQAARGLQHAHDKGLVHRDIKPSNLIVASGQCPVASKAVASGQRPAAGKDRRTVTSSLTTVKILDLGLARLQQPVLGSRTTDLTMLSGSSVTQGTPDYMAPEQALDFHSAGVPADIYSLGCTFYYLLTGQPPYPNSSIAQKLMAHQQSEPQAMGELRKRLPPDVLAVLNKMIAKEPRNRYASAGQVADALTAPVPPGRTAESTMKVYLGGDTTRVAALPVDKPAAAGGSRRRLALWLAGAVVLGMLGVWGLASSSRTSPAPKTERAATGPAPTVEEPSRGPLVTVTTVSTGKPYDSKTAIVGQTYWIDRVYKIVTISPGLDGATLVRGANSDKNVVSPAHLTLTLGQPATVYIAYDKRGQKLPAWLDDGTWQLTGETLSASDGDVLASPMRVYARRFPAGAVTLGGNKEPPAEGAGSNYVVIVKAAGGR